MKSLTPRSLKTTSLIGLISLIIPLSIFGLWIHAYKLGNNQTDRVTIFKSYFPDFLNGRWDITYLSMAFCISAIILSIISLKLSGISWKMLNYIVLIFSILSLSLNLFSMM